MGRKRHLVGILVSVVLLGVAGCGQDNAHHNEPVRQSAIPEGDRCHPTELTVVSKVTSPAVVDPSVDRITAEIRMTNTSRRTCELQGYPGLRLRDRNSMSRDTEVHRSGAVTGPLRLPEGALAVSTLVYDRPGSANPFDATCPAAVGLLVTLPDETGEFTAPIDTYGPLMCAGHTIDMTPLAPALYSLDGSVATGSVTPCRTADLTITAWHADNSGMSHLGFTVEVTDHTDHACVISGYGPSLRLVDANHNLQYPEVPTLSAPPDDIASVVLPPGSTGIMRGRYVDGPVCNQYGLDTEKPVPTAFLRAGVYGDPDTVDVPFTATVYCHGDFDVNTLAAK